MSTKTPNITLSKPGFLGEHWGPEFNANWDILDTLLGPAGHDILATHKYTGGAALDLIGLSAPSTLALISPSANPGAASAILKTDASGQLTLVNLLANTTTFNLVNATATTLNLAGAATTVNLGAASCVINGAGGLTLNGGIAANDDITIQGTSHSTRTTSYLLLQPNGGNVGIGTTGPNQRLHVNSGTADIVANFESTDTNADILLTDPTDYVRLRGREGELQLLTNGDVQTVLATLNGNVGIGTTTPAAKLAINGGVNVGADTDPGDNNLYVVGDTSSLTFTDRTPYPVDLAEAWAAVLSVRARPEGGVDHQALHPSLQSGEGRNLSALVSAQNLVIQDLQGRVAELERKAA